MAPEKVGRYPILGEIGRGGFATVYLAEDSHLQDRVAIKVLSHPSADDPNLLARFIAEARLMRELRAPGLVGVYDSGEHEGRPYFVMEYCERGTVADRFDELARPLTIDEGVGLAQAIARALAGVHRADPPVVHRDLKPSNLLIRHTPRHTQRPVGAVLGADEELLVGDFGLAKIVDVDQTQRSIVAFTRGYAAPEQARGDPTIDPRADVYSASAVIVAAISGVPPVQVFADSDVAFPPAAVAACGRLRPVLERGLAFQRQLRPRTIAEWGSELAAVNPVTNEADTATAAGPWPAPLPTTEPLATRAATDNGTVALPSADALPILVPDPDPDPGSGVDKVPVPIPVAVAEPGLGSDTGPDPDPVPDPDDRPGRSTPEPSGAAPSPLPTPEPGRAGVTDRSGRRRRPRRSIALGALAIPALVVAVVVRSLGGGGSDIVGPGAGHVGDQAAFALGEGELVEWRVDGQRTFDEVVQLTPTSPGTVVVTAVTDDGTTSIDYTVTEAPSELRIVGPSHLIVGEPTELRSEGAGPGAVIEWILDGVPFPQATLVLRPTTPGLITVKLIAGEATAQRTFTVTDG